MSRSYKHTRYSGQRNTRGMKAIANRKVRRALKRDHDLVLRGKDYRKYVESWDICDYCNIEHLSFPEYYEREVERWRMAQRTNTFWGYGYGAGDPMPTREEIWKEYCRWYVWK